LVDPTFLTESEYGVSIWTDDATLAGTYIIHLEVHLEDHDVWTTVFDFMVFDIVDGGSTDDECYGAYLFTSQTEEDNELVTYTSGEGEVGFPI